MAPAARLVKACRFSRVPITIHEKRMPRPMTRILLFASTALLAACATAQDIAPVETASTAPPAEATPAVPAEDSAELAASFEAYDQAQLELSRSEERRVGKEGGGTCRTRWAPTHKKNNTTEQEN